MELRRTTYPIADCFPVAPKWLEENSDAVGCAIYWRFDAEGPATHVVIKTDGVFLASVDAIVEATNGQLSRTSLEGITVQDLGNWEYRIFQDDDRAVAEFEQFKVKARIEITSDDMEQAGFTLLASQKEYKIGEEQKVTFNGAPIGTLDDQPDGETGGFRIQGGALQVWDKFGLVRWEGNRDSLPLGSAWMFPLFAAIVISAIGFVLVPRVKVLYDARA